MKRAIVCQGGGSKGAYSAGEIAYHIKERNHTWDEYYGTSVGALVATMASFGDAELLKEAFTTMGNKDVWSKNPIKKNGKIKIFNILVSFLRKRDALGDTSALRKNLSKLYPSTMFDYVRDHKKVIACSSNYTTGLVSYGRNDKLPYKEFLDFVWSSTCVPLLCNPVKIGDDYLQDGGLLMNTPIQQAIDNGCDEIDIFMLNPAPNDVIEEVFELEPNDVKGWKGDRMTDYVGRSLTMMMGHIADHNLILAKLIASDKNVKLRFRYLPHTLTENPIDVMMFDKKQMLQWFNDGYEYAKQRGNSIKVDI